MENSRYPDEIRDRICDLLEEGKSLREISRLPGFPARSTVKTWAENDEGFAARMLEAREAGYLALAEEGMEIALAPSKANPTDPQAARVALDAIKWKLGKLSHAFADKPLVGVQVNVGDAEAYAVFAGALEEARRARASGAHSTITVGEHGEAGSDHAEGQLAGLAGLGGAGLGKDEDGG